MAPIVQSQPTPALPAKFRAKEKGRMATHTVGNITELGVGIRDLVARAASDPAFAEQLLNNPGAFQEEYGLTPQQTDQIKVLFGKGLLGELTVQTDKVAVASYY
ncbi:MAG: hypothetical protein JNK48_13760 [Bryobacterales bacterium]|nr:hypothetical protein [Bryobacterales bacterium]